MSSMKATSSRIEASSHGCSVRTSSAAGALTMLRRSSELNASVLSAGRRRRTFIIASRSGCAKRTVISAEVKPNGFEAVASKRAAKAATMPLKLCSPTAEMCSYTCTPREPSMHEHSIAATSAVPSDTT
eukprot:6112955-Prymnesium_polylepis.2